MKINEMFHLLKSDFIFLVKKSFAKFVNVKFIFSFLIPKQYDIHGRHNNIFKT